MIDLQLIRKDREAVAAALAKKGAIVNFDELLQWDKDRRALIAEVETLKAKRNKVSGEIPLYKKQGKDTTEIFREMREIGDKISESDAKIGEIEEKINDFLAQLPNLPDDDVVAGEKENNEVVRIEGEKPVFDFAPQNHCRIAEITVISRRIAHRGFLGQPNSLFSTQHHCGKQNCRRQIP